MKSSARLRVLAVTAAIGVVLGGCSSSSSSSSGGLPKASDGTNLQACADGTCTVLVGSSAQIPLPSTYRVTGLQVQSITSHSVVLRGRDTDPTAGPNCRKNCRASSDKGNWTFTLSSPRGEGAIDKLDVTLAGTDGTNAVLLITPNVRSR
jgi:hypothetical protein